MTKAALSAIEPTEATLETRKLDTLVPHPSNSSVFAALPEPQFQQLVQSIEENGVENAIEIMPNGTILRGHERVRALKQLERDDVDCHVRYDLLGASDAEILAFVVRDNLERRQLTTLDRVRAAAALLVGRGLTLTSRISEEDREAIGAMLGLTGRSVTRLIAVARLPLRLQEAVANGELPITKAASLAGAGAAAIKDVMKRIAAAEEIRAAVSAVLAPSKTQAIAPPPTAELWANIEESMARLARMGPKKRGQILSSRAVDVLKAATALERVASEAGAP